MYFRLFVNKRVEVNSQVQTLTNILREQGLANHLLTDTQLARVIDGSAQRRYNLVNRALKAGELHRLRRGLYLLNRSYRDYEIHPFALAQMLQPGSYVSLETACHFTTGFRKRYMSQRVSCPGENPAILKIAGWGASVFILYPSTRVIFLNW